MIRGPPRSTQSRSSAASDVYKRQARVPHDVRWSLPLPDWRAIDRYLDETLGDCPFYTSPSPRDRTRSRMPPSA